MNKLPLVLLACFLIYGINSSAQTYGCTDPLANNYNAAATNNDGGCLYNAATISPLYSNNLNSVLIETSGLIRWNNWVWTHNDSQDTVLYALDTINGNIQATYPLPGVINRDWEEISQDDAYVYIGDFGNNANGNRTNLKIIRIEKNSLLANSPAIDTISFSYSDQTVFTPQGPDNTDFDCEAMIVTSDSIFLFTKQWISNKTGVYSLSKNPGTHTANYKFSIDVQGLVTGVTFLEMSNLIVLSGYSAIVQPFVYLLYDFDGTDFMNGNKRKLNVNLPFHQAEGITTNDGIKFYLSNEYLTQPPILTIPQKIHIFDLALYLGGYLDSIVSLPEIEISNDLVIYPVPSAHFVSVKTSNDFLPVEYQLTNQSGQVMLTGKLSKESPGINIAALPPGIYLLHIGKTGSKKYKVVKS